jgi:hypothetical protein
MPTFGPIKRGDLIVALTRMFPGYAERSLAMGYSESE